MKAIFVGKLDDYQHQRDGIPTNLQKISFRITVSTKVGPGTTSSKNISLLATDTMFDRNEMATISGIHPGTTGTPKGVVLSMNAIDHALSHAFPILKTGPNDRFFSYLPLSHIAERMLVEFGSSL